MNARPDFSKCSFPCCAAERECCGCCGLTASAFDRRETLAESVARLNRADAIFFQTRAADQYKLAEFAFGCRQFPQAITFQRAAAYYAAQALHSLSRFLEASA
jgi:hypothetical protein